MRAWLRFRESLKSIVPASGRTSKKQIVRWFCVLLCFSIINLTIGCKSYFKVNSSASASPEAISDMGDTGKMIVVHFNEKKWLLKEIQVKNNTISGRLVEYTLAPTLKPVRPAKPNRYLAHGKNVQRYLLNEVHLYLNEFADLGNSRISVPISSISKIEIYDKDTSSTVGSYIFGGLLIGVGAFLVVGIIVALTKESCPFIYTWDGENFNFAGEIFSGSIHKPLERNDYLKLATIPDQRSYKLKISNEVRECQHTNLLELILIDHAANVDVMMDKYGEVHTFQQPLAPLVATSLEGDTITPLIVSKDNLFYQSNSKGADTPLKAGIILNFGSQGSAKSATLAIRAKNSVILDYMMGQFHDQFGTAYKRYMKKQQKTSEAVMRKWSLDQGIPLSLYVERDNKWEFVDYFNIAGPMKLKEDVLSIPLNGKETNPLKLKLEFGNFLWEIDYAAIDYSPKQNFTRYTVPVKTATDEAQKEVRDDLLKDDQNYYSQPSMQNQAVVTFDLPELKAPQRSVILHSKGWYEILRNPEGQPDIDKLKAFRKPGHFNEFVNTKIRNMEEQLSKIQVAE